MITGHPRQGSCVLVGLCHTPSAAGGGRNCGCTEQSCICRSHSCTETMLFSVQKWGKLSLRMSYLFHTNITENRNVSQGFQRNHHLFCLFFHTAYSSAKQVHGQKGYNRTASYARWEISPVPSGTCLSLLLGGIKNHTASFLLVCWLIVYYSKYYLYLAQTWLWKLEYHNK